MISLVNLDPEVDISLTARVRGFEMGRIEGRRLSGEQMDSHNTFLEPDTVKPESISATTDDELLRVTLPARSVVILDIERESSHP